MIICEPSKDQTQWAGFQQPPSCPPLSHLLIYYSTCFPYIFKEKTNLHLPAALDLSGLEMLKKQKLASTPSKGHYHFQAARTNNSSAKK